MSVDALDRQLRLQQHNFPNGNARLSAGFAAECRIAQTDLDRGTKGLDAYYEKWENKAVELAESKGYSQSAGSLYVYVAQGADHNEYFWQQRVDKALVFFLHNLSKDVSPVIDDDALLLTPVPGGVEILSSKGGTITVSDMQGKTQLLRVSPFTPTRLPLPSGLYVIGHRKIKL